MKFQTAYSRPKVSPEITCPPGMTEQSFRNECDINQILKRFVKTGNLEHAERYEPVYGEHTGLDLKSALDIVADANNMFMDLPSETRNRFENDPAQFLDFVQDEENAEEMFKLGLRTKPPPEKTAPEAPPTENPEATPPETEQDSSTATE